jgi:hypothetical protein
MIIQRHIDAGKHYVEIQDFANDKSEKEIDGSDLNLNMFKLLSKNLHRGSKESHNVRIICLRLETTELPSKKRDC